VILNNIKR